MHHNTRFVHRLTADECRRYNLILLLFFALGTLAGFFSAELFPSSGSALFDLLVGISSMDGKGLFSVPFFQSLLMYFRIPALAFIFSFNPWRKLLLPLLLFAQSFLLSLSLFSFARCGLGGLLTAFTLLGCRYLLLMPVTLFFCGYASSVTTGNMRETASARVPLVCALLLILGAALETYLGIHFLPLLLDKYF